MSGRGWRRRRPHAAPPAARLRVHGGRGRACSAPLPVAAPFSRRLLRQPLVRCHVGCAGLAAAGPLSAAHRLVQLVAVQLEHGVAGCSALLGVAFAAAWTPCIGIVLGSILALAATGSDPLGAALLLISYGLGLGLPFIALALLAGRAAPLLARARRFTALGGRLGGALVVIIGALVASGSLPALSRLLPGLGGL